MKTIKVNKEYIVLNNCSKFSFFVGRPPLPGSGGFIVGFNWHTNTNKENEVFLKTYERKSDAREYRDCLNVDMDDFLKSKEEIFWEIT